MDWRGRRANKDRPQARQHGSQTAATVQNRNNRLFFTTASIQTSYHKPNRFLRLGANRMQFRLHFQAYMEFTGDLRRFYPWLDRSVVS